MKIPCFVALLVGASTLCASALCGCAQAPVVVIDSAATNQRVYLLAVRQDGNTQTRKVVRCDAAADGALVNCAEVPLVLEEK